MTSPRILITPKSAPLAAQLHPAALVRALWQQRHVISQLGRRQVQARHRGSFLGILWTLFNPLLLLGVYTLVFTVFMPVATDARSRVDFVLRMFCGLVVFGVFSDTIARAPTTIVANANYVKKVVFPLEALPAADLWASAVLGALNLVVLAAAVLLLTGTLPWTVVLFPLVVPPLLLLTLGVGWLVASLGVFVRDVGASIGVLLTVLFFLTPIFYEMPADWRWLMQLNPLAVLVEATRSTLVWGRPPAWGALLLAYAVSALTAQLGFAWFRATKRGFADVV